MITARALRLLSYLLVFAPAAHAAEPAGEQVSLASDALTLDAKTETYHAWGNVRMVRDGVSLMADSVTYRRLTGEAIATGGVLMERGNDTLRGDRLSLNLLTEQGELLNGDLFVKKSTVRIRAAKIEKTGDEDYRLERGSFTTCTGERPSWRFEAKDIVVTRDEYATARNAIFYAGNVPLLYSPYFIFPVQTQRQSGLLFPKFGRSTTRGFYLTQPYYWAIDQSQDATFDLDLQTSRGVGLGVEYRYLRSEGSGGNMTAYGIYDTSQQKFRGELNQRHLEVLSPDTTFASEIHATTDRGYYRDYAQLAGQYNMQLQESMVSVDHKWQRYDATAKVRYVEDLTAANNRATLQRLPTLTFTGAGEKMGPLFFSMDSSAANFQRVDGWNGQRLDLHPRLSLYRKPADILDLSVYGGYRERLYNAYGADAAAGVQAAGTADGGASLALPLEKVYQGRFRHLLIPSLGYSFVQQSRQDRLPFFDYGDRVVGGNMVEWSLANVVTEKLNAAGESPEYRDLLYLKLSQGYQITGQRRNILTLVDEGHRLADLMLESRYTPVSWGGLAVDGSYSPAGGHITTAGIAAEAKGEGGKLASLGYRYALGELNYVEGHLAYPILKPFFATFLGRYSFDKGGFLESNYSLEYRRQCWSLIFSYENRPGYREFIMSFNLSGLGVIGPAKLY